MRQMTIFNKQKESKKFCEACSILIKKGGLLNKGGYEYKDGFYCYDCHINKLKERRVERNGVRQ